MSETNTRAALTAYIVSAYVDGNRIDPAQLPALIRDVAATLSSLDAPAPVAGETLALPSRADIRRSIRPDVLISFEDGKPYKGLKRHLNKLGLTPDAYRQKWGLPGDYPMVSADYSATRSALAKAAGLGQIKPQPVAEPQKARARGKLSLFKG